LRMNSIMWNSRLVLGFLMASVVLALPAIADEAATSERIAAAHANDVPVASPLATIVPVQRVDSRPVTYMSVDGQPVTGHLAWPAGKNMGDLPALIVIHEWWGLNDNIRKTSERLAAEGYVTLAVDLYRGETAGTPKQAMQLMQLLNADDGAGEANIMGAYDYLAATMGAENIGIVGWCLGGRWSLLGSLRMPDQIDAMVMYYGAVTDDKARLTTLQMPILGHFASKDPIVPPATVVAFREALDELDKDAEIYIYPDTKHAFSNPSGLAYNPEAAELAWNRTVEFFASNLK
jgi:carboxymethylenebutenolidase